MLYTGHAALLLGLPLGLAKPPLACLFRGMTLNSLDWDSTSPLLCVEACFHFPSLKDAHCSYVLAKLAGQECVPATVVLRLAIYVGAFCFVAL